MTDRTATAGWSFTDMGPEFDQHVAAHLPGYADVQALVALVASHVVPTGGRVADLGCSTGKTAQVIRETLPRPLTFDLYDADQSMLTAASTRLGDHGDRYHHTALPEGITHDPVNLTVALWLLQFLPPDHWRQVLAAARYHTTRDGAVIIAAKTRHTDPRWDDVSNAALDDYKDTQGVTPTDRAAKTRALRGVLHQATPGRLTADLTATGWHSPTILWKWHVWTVIGAYASPIT